MSARPRRANAGSRLKSLIAEQIPLNDEDAEIFAERDDDEDFDLEAEEERARLERETRSHGEKEAESNDENNDEDEDEDEDDDSDSEEHDDSNFSDSTDDSELENDEEPADAGEKELQKEQRQSTREKRIAERNKLFTIKRRDPKPPDARKESKKKRVFTSADILRDKGRRSERKSAMRSKQHLIEQMKEAEERRAQYVPPKRTNAPKLTQEQRLEEAKKTEARNLASLNKFVELEEERKLQQRLAMISRRPRLTNFIRFHSASYLEAPRLIEQHDSSATESAEQVETESTVSMPLDSSSSDKTALTGDTESQPRNQTKAPSEEATLHQRTVEDINAENHDTPQVKLEHPTDKVKPLTEGSQLSGITQGPVANQPVDSIEKTPAEQEVPILAERNKDVPDADDKRQSTPGVEQVAIEKGDSTTPQEQLQTDGKQEGVTPGLVKDEIEQLPKSELADGDAVIVKPSPPEVYGPSRLRDYDFLTLHGFDNIPLNRFAVRGIVIGATASSSAHPPQKRMCPFSGKVARYIDPSSGVAYRDLATNKLLKLAKEGKLAWSNELGGVFSETGAPARHAKGVPEGFV